MQNSGIYFLCSHEKTPLYSGKVDKIGRASCAERSISLSHPSHGDVSFQAVNPENGEVLSANGNVFETCLSLDEAMLFSPYTHRLIHARKKEKPYLFGSRRFILYLKLGNVLNSVKLENLKIINEAASGSYRVLGLEWKDQSNPCRIIAGETENYIWVFNKCLQFRLYINPVRNDSPQHVIFKDCQRLGLSDFDLVLNPFPTIDIVDQLFWNIIVNDYSPKHTPLKKFLPSSAETSLRLPGNVLEEMIRPVYNPDTEENAKIEISLCSADETFASRVFFVFPHLQVETPPAVREGDEFNVKVDLGHQGVHNLLMENELGKSKIKIRLNRTEQGTWQLHRSEFKRRLEIDSLGTQIDVSAVPPYRAIRFGNKQDGKVEPAREILKRELSPYDLIIVSGQQSEPEIIINNEKVETAVNMCEDGIWVLPLNSLPNILYPENDVRIYSKGINEGFIIKYRLALLKMAVESYAVDNTVSGKCSYRGPLGSEIELRVYAITKDNESTHAASYRLKAEGREVLDQSFALAVGSCDELGLPSHSIEYYEMAAVLKDNDNKYEYGERWVIRNQSELFENNNIPALKSIEKLLKENRPLAAKRIFDQVKAPDNPTRMEGLKEEINKSILHNSFKNIVESIKHVLEKEYLFKI